VTERHYQVVERQL